MHTHDGKLTISKHISLFSGPEEWLAHINKFKLARKKAPSSKTVPDVQISTRSNGFTIKFARTVKRLTEAEVDLLCAEYGFDRSYFINTITKRRVAIYNEAGEQTNASKSKSRKAKASKATKANADNEARGRTDDSRDQLIEPGPNTDMLTQG